MDDAALWNSGREPLVQRAACGVGLVPVLATISGKQEGTVGCFKGPLGGPERGSHQRDYPLASFRLETTPWMRPDRDVGMFGIQHEIFLNETHSLTQAHTCIADECNQPTGLVIDVATRTLD